MRKNRFSFKKWLNILIVGFLKIFYADIRGANPYHIIATVFFSQKILRINGTVPWPVDFRCRILYPRRLRLGKRSFPGWSPGCYIQARNGIEIGNFRMGPGVDLISANHDVNDYDHWPVKPPIQIGNNVWIGMNTIVLPGVRIGDNVAISANSVVTNDIPSNSVAAGNPCQILREKPPYRGKLYE